MRHKRGGRALKGQAVGKGKGGVDRSIGLSGEEKKGFEGKIGGRKAEGKKLDRSYLRRRSTGFIWGKEKEKKGDDLKKARERAGNRTGSCGGKKKKGKGKKKKPKVKGRH